MWSTMSEVQAYLQYFEEAAEYARKMVEGYTWVQTGTTFMLCILFYWSWSAKNNNFKTIETERKFP